MALDLGFVPYAEFSGACELSDLGFNFPDNLFVSLSYKEFRIIYILTDPNASGTLTYRLDAYFHKEEWNSSAGEMEDFYKELFYERGTMNYSGGILEFPQLAENQTANPGFFTPSKENRDYFLGVSTNCEPSLVSIKEGNTPPSGALSYIFPKNRRLRLFFNVSPEYKISEVHISGDVSDEQLTFSWEVGDQTRLGIEILDDQGNVVFAKFEDTTRQNVTLPAAALGTGLYTARMQVGYSLKSVFGGLAQTGIQTEVFELPITVHRIEPEIIAFEPDSVPQRWDEPMQVYWTSEHQHRFALVLRQAGQIIKAYTGETATAVDIPAGTLSAGATEATLTLTYIPTWGTEEDKVETSKTISFEAYGVPPIPVITMPATVGTAYPEITWTSSEQYTYRLRIYCGDTLVQDTGEVQSAAQSYILTEPLALGTYTVKLTVKSEYGLYSPEASKDVLVAFEVPPMPVLFVHPRPERCAIEVNIDNAASDLFDHADLIRRPAGTAGNWVRLATWLPLSATYMDYTVASDVPYEYAVRAIGTTGGYSESDPAVAAVSVRWTQIFDPAHPDEPVVLQLEPTKSQTDKRGIYQMLCAGASRPRFEFSGDRYAVIDATFLARRDAYERLCSLYYSVPVLCLRDNQGRRLFGCISRELEAEDEMPGLCKVKLQFTECDFVEGV